MTNKPAIAFTILRFADVSTQHITPQDGILIQRPASPFCLGVDPSGEGTFFYVPDRSEELDLQELVDFGFSPAFVNIFKELSKADIGYVRFDGSSATVPGLPKFAW